jgi:FAD/FMN-containing dehydrogenase
MKIAQGLADILSAANVKTEDEISAIDPGFDPRNLGARVVAFPQSTEDISRVLAFCHTHGASVVAQGGRTGLAGGAASRKEDVVLSLSRLNRIIAIDPDAATATVEAGVPLAMLDQALAAHGLSVGVDLGARDSATIGGMVSTNAGGIEAFHHGVMRNRVLGLEAVLADGTIVSDLTNVLKCNEGYDVKHLFIGAEGTLGIVTRLVLRLAPRPKARATGLAAAKDLAGPAASLRSRHHRNLAALELMNGCYARLAIDDHGETQLKALAAAPFLILFEIEEETPDAATERLAELLSGALAREEIADAVIAKSEDERQRFWKLREDSWVVERRRPGGLWFDVSLPLAKLDAYLHDLEQRLSAHFPETGLYVIGHLGDGNLHITVAGPKPLADASQPITDHVYRGIKEMGGSFSAEHGIGLDKREALATLSDPGKLHMMRLLKATLDPRGILNPGKVLKEHAPGD